MSDRTPIILAEIHAERIRQDAKWGEQNHPNGTGPGALRDVADTGTTADAAKGHCDRMFAEGRGTYMDILWEEFAEAVEERDPVKLRAELVQVAAVAEAWIEKIDRDVARGVTASPGPTNLDPHLIQAARDASAAGRPIVVIAGPDSTFRFLRPDEWAAATEAGADVPAVSPREWDVPRLTPEMIAEMQPPKPNRAQRRARR